jgi:integrase
MKLQGLHYDADRKRAVLDGFVPGTGGTVRRQRTIENVTKAQAFAEWKKFRADLESGRAVDGPMTMQQFIDLFFDDIGENHQESTRSTQRTLLDCQILPYFGKTKLEEISSIRVAKFIAHMKKSGRSPSYTNNAVRLIKMLLRQAVERDVIADYPLKKKVPKEKEKPLRLELTREERERFFAVFDDEAAFRRYLDDKRKLGPVAQSESFKKPRRFGGGLRGDSKAAGVAFARFQELRELFVVAVETGLRKSDLRNLRRNQLDFAEGFIRVLMQKTSLEAEIPISAACRNALLAVEARCGRGEHVFRDATGKRYSHTRIRRTFVLAKKLAGITRRFRPHDLRHTFGCRLASSSVGLQIIAKALGHTTTRMAERYARPSEEAMRIVVKALDADPLFTPRQ